MAGDTNTNLIHFLFL